MNLIEKRLFQLQDVDYGRFQKSLIPNINGDTVIGVRTPALKRLAKELYGTNAGDKFINSLPHRYFEENQLHAFIIGLEKDVEKCLCLVKKFLPYIDNWATCDQLTPKCFYKAPERLRSEIEAWLDSKEVYTVRFGIVASMRYYLGDGFDESLAEKIGAIKSEEYYIKMAVAWYFATALAKNRELVFRFIENKCLDDWTHNKTIQKALESFRICQEDKIILKGMKV